MADQLADSVIADDIQTVLHDQHHGTRAKALKDVLRYLQNEIETVLVDTGGVELPDLFFADVKRLIAKLDNLI